MIDSIDSEIVYERVSLMADIRAGVDRIRRLKVTHAKTKTETGKTKYSMEAPPPVFVRKALESDEEDVQKELLPR